jgi:hypothetical protein
MPDHPVKGSDATDTREAMSIAEARADPIPINIRLFGFPLNMNIISGLQASWVNWGRAIIAGRLALEFLTGDVLILLRA